MSGTKSCENSCTAFNKYFYSDENECLATCKGLPNLEFADAIDNTHPTQPCKAACGSTQFYDSDNNICFSSCLTGGDPNKKYHAYGGKVCYSSCTQIPEGDYIYESNYVCYKSISQIPNPSTYCENYYIKPNGAKQCTTRNGCISYNQTYFINDECRGNCDGYYKLKDASGTFTKCFETIADVLKANNGVRFYNINSKLCWSSLPSGYYINTKQIETGGTNLKYEVVDNGSQGILGIGKKPAIIRVVKNKEGEPVEKAAKKAKKEAESSANDSKADNALF